MSHEFFDLIRGVNAKGWRVLNFFQIGSPIIWRVNLQRRLEKGAAQEVFSEFSEHPDPIEALRGAVANAVARDKAMDGRTRTTAEYAGANPKKADDRFKPAQEKRLSKALDANFAARKGAKPHGRS